jgi:hypothetical protein
LISKWRNLLLALVVVAASAFLVACGDDDEESGSASGTETTMETSGDVSTDTEAAELRAGLTHLLTEHVDLAGIAVVQAATADGGLESPQFAAAAKTLDGNSQDLADAVGSVYGDAAGKQFLELWRSHIDMFVEYAEGRLTGDDKLAEKAAADLDQYRSDFGAFIESATEGGLTKDAVAEALEPHVASVAKTVDEIASGKGNPYVSLQEAASHMPDIANVLAGAIAEQNGLEGDVESGASTLRSDLTALLDGHVYAAAITLNTAIGAGGDLKDPSVVAAQEALQDNTDALSETIGSVYGAEAGDQFKALWESHIGFFVDYTLASATGDEKAAKKAEQDLDGYREDFGAFLESANPNLTKEAVAEALDPHVQSLLTTIDSAVAGDTKVFDNLRTAASHDVDLANTLAGAIAAQFPEMFGSS